MQRMSMLIISAGPSLSPLAGNFDSAGFDAAWAACLDADARAPEERRIAPGSRKVLVAEDRLALSSAGQLLETEALPVEPLLNEVPLRSFTDTDRVYPADKWLRRAAAQRKHRDPRQPESREQLRARAERLIGKLEAEGGYYLLVTHPLFLTELLDRLRVHGYVIQRSGVMQIRPWEKIVVSRREEHCGGCQHNCFLSNPGCGVGRDKARRNSG